HELAILLEHRLAREEERALEVLADHDDVRGDAGPQPGVRLVETDHEVELLLAGRTPSPSGQAGDALHLPGQEDARQAVDADLGGESRVDADAVPLVDLALDLDLIRLQHLRDRGPRIDEVSFPVFGEGHARRPPAAEDPALLLTGDEAAA